ncbi:hypothetical protein EDC94DRAFT_583248 [Helicostylum pulchrum]|uniref:WRKY domain-containing protein n=1 Tax=Helicostylum pulchrum TaxID=562976 RepID=A0ABP9Y2R4_9FUNG|nr:hypothetical protein EDC94DRAFT_583248 [Helicostylum pulchrum]
MNEFSYPALPKDNDIFFSNESLSFTRPIPINKTNSFSQPQEFQWKDSSIPSVLMPTQSPIDNNNDGNNPATNPIACDLQEVIVYYQSQPELLRLILLSKVEEDKRRTEEAKLRAKELDMILVQQQHQFNYGSPQTPEGTIMSAPQATTTNHSPVSNNSNNNNNNLLNISQFSQEHRRPSVLEILMDDSDCDRRDSALGSSFDGSANSDEVDDRTFSPTSCSVAASMLSMSFPPQPMMSVTAPRSSLHPLSPSYNISQNIEEANFSAQVKVESENFSPEQQQNRRYDCYFPQRPRRRREMQAISKIVETRDYPYIDGFFWKNNGNTVQKKTGNKSVYYKCSNSSKGCPVNKTVTWKENGEFLIKYRGEHLAECGNVQRIVDV